MNTQKGSAHIIIIIALVVLLAGAIGYIFWQNVNKKDVTATPSQTKTSTEKKLPTKPLDEPEKLTYEHEMLSFDYPAGWNVKYEIKHEFPVWTVQSETTDSEVSVFGYGDYSQLTYEQKIEELKIGGISDIEPRKISGIDGVTFADSRNPDYPYGARIFVTTSGLTYGMTAGSGDNAKKTFNTILNSIKLKNS